MRNENKGKLNCFADSMQLIAALMISLLCKPLKSEFSKEELYSNIIFLMWHNTWVDRSYFALKNVTSRCTICVVEKEVNGRLANVTPIKQKIYSILEIVFEFVLFQKKLGPHLKRVRRLLLMNFVISKCCSALVL